MFLDLIESKPFSKGRHDLKSLLPNAFSYFSRRKQCISIKNGQLKELKVW